MEGDVIWNEKWTFNILESCYVVILALGSWPRWGLAKLRTKSEARESHFMLLKVWESMREWTFTLPSELPLWTLESQWIFKFSESNWKG
jgi:hypothetical protein